MSELERALTALAAEIDWPPAPELALDLDFEPVALRRRGRRRMIAIAVALALFAVALAFAVPDSRSAILRFLHLGGVTVERVSTLPAAEERSLAADLGRPVSREEAESALGGPFALPKVHGEPQLHEQSGVVSAVLALPEPVLVSEFRPPGGGTILKKVAMTSSTVESVPIDATREGLWIAGEEHVVYWLAAPPRLAGNVLLWEDGGVTYRIEGRTLTKERALELAREMTG